MRGDAQNIDISKSVIDVKQKELCHKAFLAEKRKNTKIQELMQDNRKLICEKRYYLR